jgi:hypothetical protein
MRVHSFDHHAEVADFVPTDGTLRTYRRSVAPTRTAPLRGHYATLDREIAVLYRDTGGLKFFRPGVGVVELSSGVTVSWQLVTRNKAQLSISGDDPVQIVYRSNANRIAARIAATPNGRREDWDFGLFIANVLKDPERRDRLYVDENLGAHSIDPSPQDAQAEVSSAGTD